MATILLLNGPNLDQLGEREPAVYGHEGLDELVERLGVQADQAGHRLASFQSNAEHELIDRIHAARREEVAFLLFNPAAFTHTSIALRDALAAAVIPFIEIHISNIAAREPFRHHSYMSDLAEGVISGLGTYGYELALAAALRHLAAPSQEQRQRLG